MVSLPQSPVDCSTSVSSEFRLIWTIGFVGKRFLCEEDKIGRAIDRALSDLLEKAKAARVRLTAVSSLARGGDILFAEACERKEIPWRCLLPLPWDEFLKLDLVSDDPRGPLTPEDRAVRLERAKRLRSLSFGELPAPEAGEGSGSAPNVFPDPAVVTQGVIISDPESLDSAYQDCSYRSVDEADVMICVLANDEFREIAGQTERTDNAKVNEARAGTKPTVLYARAARRPCILLNADAADPWEKKEFLNIPKGIEWFVDPVITSTVAEAWDWNELPPADPLTGPVTSERLCTWKFMQRLEGVARHHQSITRSGLHLILVLHLSATFIAALCATVLSRRFASWWLLGLAFLAFVKSSLVFTAWLKEKWLHRDEHRDRWLNARILAESCRSAIAMWPLPLQPLDATDEEDFPRSKRFIRTLRLMRSLDREAGVRGTPPQPGETSLEANMREACAQYRENRLLYQAKKYYAQRVPQHCLEQKRWRRGFKASLWCAMVAGLVIAGFHVWEHRQTEAHSGGRSPGANEVAEPGTYAASGTTVTNFGMMHDLEKSMEALLIIAPFFATYCLGMITILDSRRRSTRYEEMRHYLERLGDTLANCLSNPSRLRLIEHAERMIIEEQHEWFSATRNANI